MNNPLMEYLTPMQHAQQPHCQPPQIAAQVGGAMKYHGAVAAGYNAKREDAPKWKVEQGIIEGMLDDLPSGSKVLDCPVGTGRFLPFYVAKGFEFIGADISGDMLIQAARRMGANDEDIKTWVNASKQAREVQPVAIATGNLVQGDCRQIGLPDKSVDAAVACRITRWLSPDDCVKMMKELQRVTRHRIIWTARIANHPHARTIELFEGALDGWAITHNEVGADMDYRILQARPV